MWVPDTKGIMLAEWNLSKEQIVEFVRDSCTGNVADSQCIRPKWTGDKLAPLVFHIEFWLQAFIMQMHTFSQFLK